MLVRLSFAFFTRKYFVTVKTEMREKPARMTKKELVLMDALECVGMQEQVWR